MTATEPDMTNARPTMPAGATTSVVTPSTVSSSLQTSDTLGAVADFDEWMVLARTTYQRLADEFAAAPGDGWTAPTSCEGWTVRDLGGHLVGAMRSAASVRKAVSQQRAFKQRAKRTGEQEVDPMTAIQIERTAELTVGELVAEMQSLVPTAVAGRSRMPGFLRRRAGFFVEMGELSERWTLDYFLSTTLTRDAWLHRIDLADALGLEPGLADDDRTIVGDVAVEWCARHERPVSLTLTGAAGGQLVTGTGGPVIDIDAIEFCRIVSGRRAPMHPLLEHAVPF